MLDDFFTRAIIAGLGVALVAGPLGCFIIWRRLAYFGDTLSHAALLGVALAFLLEVDITLAVFAVSVLISLALLWPVFLAFAIYISRKRSKSSAGHAYLGRILGTLLVSSYALYYYSLHYSLHATI